MSGGWGFFCSSFPPTLCYLRNNLSCDVQNAVDIGAKPAMRIPLPFHKLNQSLLLQKVQMALNRPWAAGEFGSQCLHPRPTESSFVVAVVSQGAVGWDHF